MWSARHLYMQHIAFKVVPNLDSALLIRRRINKYIKVTILVTNSGTLQIKAQRKHC